MCAVLPANSALTNGGSVFCDAEDGWRTDDAATDTVIGVDYWSSGAITVSAAATATHFSVTAVRDVRRLDRDQYYVTSRAASNATATGYPGTVACTRHRRKCSIASELA